MTTHVALHSVIYCTRLIISLYLYTGFQTSQDLARLLDCEMPDMRSLRHEDDKCVRVLVKWVNKTNANNGGKLFGIVRDYEEKQCRSKYS